MNLNNLVLIFPSKPPARDHFSASRRKSL